MVKNILISFMYIVCNYQFEFLAKNKKWRAYYKKVTFIEHLGNLTSEVRHKTSEKARSLKWVGSSQGAFIFSIILPITFFLVVQVIHGNTVLPFLITSHSAQSKILNLPKDFNFCQLYLRLSLSKWKSCFVILYCF